VPNRLRGPASGVAGCRSPGATLSLTWGQRFASAHHVGLDRAPQHRASCARCRTTESIGNKHAVDHVGKYRDPRPTFDADRHDDGLDTSSVDLALHGAIDALEPRRTAETWHHKPCGARHLA